MFELAHYMLFTRHIRTNCISVTSSLVQRGKVRGNLTQSYHMTQGIWTIFMLGFIPFLEHDSHGHHEWTENSCENIIFLNPWKKQQHYNLTGLEQHEGG